MVIAPEDQYAAVLLGVMIERDGGSRPRPGVTRRALARAGDPIILDRMGTSEPQGRRREVARADVAAQLRALGVDEGGVLLVHTSFRAARPIEGGPLGLIHALRDALGPDGTLTMPTWTGDGDTPFDAGQTPAAADLGIVADTFWRLHGVARSGHPFAFAAAGPAAHEITSDPLPLPPHIPESPVGRVHDLDGQVLLLGVGHDANTTLHLAEIIAGAPYRVPKHCTVLEGDEPVRIEYGENDHCCARFIFADEWLRAGGVQAEGPVGHAHARLVRSREIVRVAVDELRREPLVFLHRAGGGCAECDQARASVRR
jgi:aminoglycoside N3'-acetyltransferase